MVALFTGDYAQLAAAVLRMLELYPVAPSPLRACVRLVLRVAAPLTHGSFECVANDMACVATTQGAPAASVLTGMQSPFVHRCAGIFLCL